MAGTNRARGEDFEEITALSVHHASITICDTHGGSNQSPSSVKY